MGSSGQLLGRLASPARPNQYNDLGDPSPKVERLKPTFPVRTCARCSCAFETSSYIRTQGRLPLVPLASSQPCRCPAALLLLQPTPLHRLGPELPFGALLWSPLGLLHLFLSVGSLATLVGLFYIMIVGVFDDCAVCIIVYISICSACIIVYISIYLGPVH